MTTSDEATVPANVAAAAVADATLSDRMVGDGGFVVTGESLSAMGTADGAVASGAGSQILVEATFGSRVSADGATASAGGRVLVGAGIFSSSTPMATSLAIPEKTESVEKKGTYASARGARASGGGVVHVRAYHSATGGGYASADGAVAIGPGSMVTATAIAVPGTFDARVKALFDS